MKLSDILAELQVLAPLHLAEDWDEVGLHVGDPGTPGSPGQRVSKALLCIDLTEAVLDEAIKQGAQLIVAYHSAIFKPLPRLTTEDVKQRIIWRAARKGIAIYSPHTALDAAEGGVNDWLASGLGDGEVRTILPSKPEGGQDYKLVTFVPEGALDAVRSAMSRAGAGRIGDYESCSFSAEGVGTFHGGTDTSPTVGKAGRLERVTERRLEMPVPGRVLASVTAALREAHPYEEPAFDVYPVESTPEAARTGQGRVVTLTKAVSLTTLTKRIKTMLGVDHLEVGTPKGMKRVQRIGLCAGSGGSLMPEAGTIDAFFTGEMRHHEQLEAVSRGVAVLLAGHTQTERPYLQVFRKRLATATGGKLQWRVSKADRPPVGVK